jgi:hypothetical protein
MDMLLYKPPPNSSRVPAIKHQSHSMPLATRKITSDRHDLTQIFAFNLGSMEDA